MRIPGRSIGAHAVLLAITLSSALTARAADVAAETTL